MAKEVTRKKSSKTQFKAGNQKVHFKQKFKKPYQGDMN